ncbi:hypothetical protein DAEQUDRAFT_228 [Daedalea quercina L-15889]|uniref:Uncharacterized protein n=1 Tax=Daedalea quercina L-15889 TaxID=1314783 RepID=A0A165UAR3_9APHY|nr:hypothetical protein DAEQUDRAFT_228 [Daedalea quercina L-15889]
MASPWFSHGVRKRHSPMSNFDWQLSFCGPCAACSHPVRAEVPDNRRVGSYCRSESGQAPGVFAEKQLLPLGASMPDVDCRGNRGQVVGTTVTRVHGSKNIDLAATVLPPPACEMNRCCLLAPYSFSIRAMACRLVCAHMYAALDTINQVELAPRGIWFRRSVHIECSPIPEACANSRLKSYSQETPSM